MQHTHSAPDYLSDIKYKFNYNLKQFVTISIWRSDVCRCVYFWALQESEMVESNPSFANYYMHYIGHFVRVYEGTAPMFAKESFRWYTEPYSNTKLYLNNGCKIKDVLSLSLWQKIAHFSEHEANDSGCP